MIPLARSHRTKTGTAVIVTAARRGRNNLCRRYAMAIVDADFPKGTVTLKYFRNPSTSTPLCRKE